MNGILWVYGHHEQSGYARNSREFIKALNHNGVPTKFLNWNKAESYPEYETMRQFEAEDGFPYDLVIHNVVPPSFKRIGNKKNILMTVAETDSISQAWVDKCNQADEVWTVSYYCQAAFVHSGVKVPVRVVLMPIDIKQIRESAEVKEDLKASLENFRSQNSFIFFANSEWTPRKGWDILIDSFFKTFAQYKDVGLLIKTCSFSLADNATSVIKYIYEMKRKYNADCKAMLCFSLLDIEDVWAMYRYTDAFVLPSRGEGCGIPYMEAMASGLPVICPSRGGQVDYINPNIATTVKSSLTKARRFPHNPNYDESMLWIETDKEDLSYKMMNLIVNSKKHEWQTGAEIFEDMCGYDGTAIQDFIAKAEAVIK